MDNGVIMVWIVIIGAIAYKIHLIREDHRKYPNKFRNLCGYCGTRHGRNQYTIGRVDKDYCYENGLVFLSQECSKYFQKENVVCCICYTQQPKTEESISHKFKRDEYEFCSTDCKDSFREKYPEVFHEGYHRHSIPSDLRKIIWKRDGGKCVKCGSDEELEYDHIIPVTKGGATSKKNLELLCSVCNRSKSAKIE